MNDENQKPVRLPLWRTALEKLLAQGVSYGCQISSEWFEEELRAKAGSVEYNTSVSEIRDALRERGYYLNGRGLHGQGFEIVPPALHADVMDQCRRAATKALKRGVILGTNTPLDRLNDQERKRHEGILEKLAIKSALLRHSGSVTKIIQKHSPKLLADKEAA